ncbi:coproporphyrinogen III oxidase [Acidocella aminolytica 101 = DSM 11237]|uniref:Coproporphyrinogen-III oxidase n=2 Tax=Acidocella TaxID=50709 RepID=A0A0D6PER9_9PROT|nr:coproporphyrinogen III oxidase [Acidocella aminolytica 101 = DSM 11237]
MSWLWAMTDADLIARYDGRVPRYTSYPTAPHFHDGIGVGEYAHWLAALPPDAAISLYLHVPFCDRLCLYCGCHTTVVHHDRPKRNYAQALAREIGLVADRLGRRARVSQIHWGGGTPTSLPDDCLDALMELIRVRFDVAPDAEIAIEIDPASLPPGKLEALAQMGVTRASLGVQDFDETVQKAIGRMQSFDETRDAAEGLRRLGVASVNLDLIYGLPHQTEESVTRTARLALELAPDRAAVFGYAHVPWMKKHQKLMPEAALPMGLARLRQEATIRGVLAEEGGMVPVGLDHYAHPADAMANAAHTGALQRGFQGYTTDAASVLIGLGASAIGALPEGYVQNLPSIPAYEASLAQGRLPVARGVALSHEDRLRRAVIERIMCDLAVDLPAMAQTFGAQAAPLLAAAAPLSGFESDGLVEWNGARLRVTERGRPFVRNVAALFDAYLRGRESSQPRHARAV